MPASSPALEDKVRFDIVRYANCWEDADVLIEALDIKKNGTYLSIASAGDNSFSIISRGAGRVIAVDLSTAQIACTELRANAFRQLDYEELLAFLGVNPSVDRLSVYRKLRDCLSKESRSFWDALPGIINGGIIFAGKFERYFRLFRTHVLPLAHSRKNVAALLEEKSADQRKDYFTHHWNNRRWRLIFKLFFSRFAMGRLGRDPTFFKYVEGNVAERIMKRVEHALTNLPTHSNPYLQFILNGHFTGALPHYLRGENFTNIRHNLDALELRKCTVAEALGDVPERRFDGFNLSDIFEYMSMEQFTGELEQIAARSNPGARVVYWNMLADRSRPDKLADRLHPLSDVATDLFARDKAFFYKALIIEETR